MYAVARAELLPLETLESGQERNYYVASRKRSEYKSYCPNPLVLTDKTKLGHSQSSIKLYINLYSFDYERLNSTELE